MASHDLASIEPLALPGALRAETGDGGLPCLRVDTPACRGRVYLLGGTATHWQPAGHAPVLFTSAAAHYEEGRAIRGGVPVCLPWFADHPTDPAAPSHGTVRTVPWRAVRSARGGGGVEIDLTTDTGALRADLRLTFGAQLTLALTVTNRAATEQTYEAALHAYFNVGDARRVRITGLEHTDYLDKTDGGARRNQGPDPVTFTGATDRVYQGTAAACILHDPVLNRRVVIEKRGSDSTVVWNPWADKAARMGDLGDDEWTSMCCIETANVGAHAVTLAPGESHTTAASVRVEPD